MKIGIQLIVLFSILIVATVSASSGIAFQSVEKSVIDSEIQDMNSIVNFKENEIQTLHDRASENLIFAVQNTIFIDYFELRDTRAGNIYDDDVKLFTLPQQVLVDKLEKWMYNFQNKFLADEISIIDNTGQEHVKFIFQDIAPDNYLSSEKETAPFFEPSFLLEKDKVHLQYPYFSPDSERWVFAYTTPIVITDNSKPAFLHFEMPVAVFQELVDVDVGRIYVVDPDGFIIADSDDASIANAKYNVNSETMADLDPQEYFPSIETVDTSSEFNDIVQEMHTSTEGSVTYSKDGEKIYVSYKQIPTFGWTLVYEKPYSLLLHGENNLNSLRTSMAIIAMVISIGGLFAVIIVSSKITSPINKLAVECKNQNPAQLKKVTISTKDELSDVSTSINDMINRVNKMETQKEEFSSMITHELKTPLTPIIGWCQTLQNPKILGSINEKQSKAVDTILRNAKRLQMMIGDVLDAQKLDMDKMKFDYKEISVNEFLEYLHSNLQHVMKPKRIEYINNTKEELTMQSDKNRLEQVFNNLIFNAVDFVPEENGRIEISAKDNGNFILFNVKDNGTGIAKDKQEDLFKKFYQVNTTLARKHGGTGLGLSVSKGIIEGLGGKISVESEEGKGSDFQFTIPKEPKSQEKQKE